MKVKNCLEFVTFWIEKWVHTLFVRWVGGIMTGDYELKIGRKGKYRIFEVGDEGKKFNNHKNVFFLAECFSLSELDKDNIPI